MKGLINSPDLPLSSRRASAAAADINPKRVPPVHNILKGAMRTRLDRGWQQPWCWFYSGRRTIVVQVHPSTDRTGVRAALTRVIFDPACSFAMGTALHRGSNTSSTVLDFIRSSLPTSGCFGPGPYGCQRRPPKDHKRESCLDT